VDNSIYCLWLCRKHISQKRKKEQKPTASWSAPGLEPGKMFLREGEERAEKNLLSKQMLNKKLRVSKQVFNNAVKKSKILSSPRLFLRVFKETRPIHSKFSFTISKSVSKKAIIRNLLKRRGYSIIRKNLKKLKNSYICIFSFKKGSEKATFKEIEEEITSLLKKAKILDF